MSRSYKHSPVCSRRSGFSKTRAKRKVRRNKMNLYFSKGGYKKFTILGKFEIILVGVLGKNIGERNGNGIIGIW